MACAVVVGAFFFVLGQIGFEAGEVASLPTWSGSLGAGVIAALLVLLLSQPS